MQQQPAAEQTTLTLSPNPVKDQLSIRGNDKVSVLRIYDISGREVMRVKNPGSTISVSSLHAGSHIVVLERKDGSQKQVKILKQ